MADSFCTAPVTPLRCGLIRTEGKVMEILCTPDDRCTMTQVFVPTITRSR
jgi:hypothetical protein